LLTSFKMDIKEGSDRIYLAQWYIQGDRKVSVHLTIAVKISPHRTDDLKMAIAEYIRNVDRAILYTVFENTVRRVNKCQETGGGHLNITCNFLYCNHQVHRDFLITLYRFGTIWRCVPIQVTCVS
jgi:hypothetical protein